MKIEENVPLGRLTTVGIGGPARHFARPGTVEELQEALAWAAEQGVDVFTIGLGSNLLIADDGVDALVLRLEGELADARRRRRAACRGRWGDERRLSPSGPRRGARRLRVRLRDPRNGRRRRADERGRLRRRLERDPRARARRLRRTGPSGVRPPSSGSSTGAPDCAPARSSRAPSSGSSPSSPEEIKATVAELQAQRKAAQPTNKRTFGSVFKNPEHELSAGRMLEACGLRGHRIGGAQISPRHANFIENAGEGTRRRRARVDGRSTPEGARGVRRRARARGPLRRRARASGRRLRRRVGLPAAAPNNRDVPAARKPRSRPAVLALPRRHVLVPIRITRFLPSGRSLLVGFGLLGLAVGGYLVARETSMFSVREMEVTGARPSVVRRVDEALAPLAGKSLLTVDAACDRPPPRATPRREPDLVRPGFSAHGAHRRLGRAAGRRAETRSRRVARDRAGKSAPEPRRPHTVVAPSDLGGRRARPRTASC